MKNQNTTLLIDGIFSENSLKIVNLYVKKFKKIVIFRYFGNKNVYLTEFKSQYVAMLNLNIKLLENTIPNVKKLHNSQNIYMQCFSTIEGLKPRNMFKYIFDRLHSKFRKLTNEY